MSSSSTTLLELGERYAALGLPAAARAAFSRALAASDSGDAAAARRLTELAIAGGDSAARDFAREVVRREPGPASCVLMGRAHLAAGEVGAARLAFVAALEAVGASRLVRARAYLGVARAALREGDRAGAAANAMTGVDEVIAFVSAEGRQADEVDAEIATAESLISQAIALGRAGDVTEVIETLRQKRPTMPHALLRAAALSARQVLGDPDVSDAEVETALAEELALRPASRATRLRLVERKLRRRYRDASARTDALAELESLAEEMKASVASVVGNVELARVYFLLAAAYEDDPTTSGKAEDAYRSGLKLRPGHAAAANRLALLTLARGDSDGALLQVERSLRIDADHGLAWRNAARVLGVSGAGADLGELVERLLDAAKPGAGAAAGVVAPRLITATAEVARGEVLAGMYARGHRLKNLLGIIGSRTRSARKLAETDESDEMTERLGDLETEVTRLYDEWSEYLRSMRTVGPVIEIVPVAGLIAEVVREASEKTSQVVRLDMAGAIPDLRGDRMLLKEALLNVVSNAAEAVSEGGAVDVRVRSIASGGTHVIEIDVVDDGPGIPRAELIHVFAPGYTTKEKGSGLGLAIAERVVVAHHGRIAIDSEEGRGTAVSVLLPSDLGGFSQLASYSTDSSESSESSELGSELDREGRR